MLYAYAIFEPSADGLGDVRGVDDGAVCFHRENGIGVAWSEVTRAARPTPENVWRHEQVVEAIMRGGAVLPVRFGTVLSDLAALDALLERNRDRLSAGLRRVRGCVELGVR